MNILLSLALLVYVLFTIVNVKASRKNTPVKYRNTLYMLHIIFGILLGVFGAVHGIVYLKNASMPGIITGVLNLVILYAEIITGFLYNRLPAAQKQKCQKFHKLATILLLACILCHIIVIKVVL